LSVKRQGRTKQQKDHTDPWRYLHGFLSDVLLLGSIPLGPANCTMRYTLCRPSAAMSYDIWATAILRLTTIHSFDNGRDGRQGNRVAAAGATSFQHSEKSYVRLPQMSL